MPVDEVAGPAPDQDMQPDPAAVTCPSHHLPRRREAIPLQLRTELDPIGPAGTRRVDAFERLAADFDEDAQIAAFTQVPPLREDSTAASMNFTPRTPSSTVGVSIAAGSASRPSIAAQTCSAASE